MFDRFRDYRSRSRLVRIDGNRCGSCCCFRRIGGVGNNGSRSRGGNRRDTCDHLCFSYFCGHFCGSDVFFHPVSQCYRLSLFLKPDTHALPGILISCGGIRISHFKKARIMRSETSDVKAVLIVPLNDIVAYSDILVVRNNLEHVENIPGIGCCCQFHEFNAHFHVIEAVPVIIAVTGVSRTTELERNRDIAVIF